MNKEKMKMEISEKLKNGEIEFTVREVQFIKEMLLKDELDKYNLEINDLGKFSNHMKEYTSENKKDEEREVKFSSKLKYFMILLAGIISTVIITMFIIRVNSINNWKHIYYAIIIMNFMFLYSLYELNMEVKVPDLQNKVYNRLYKITNWYWKILNYTSAAILIYIAMTR